MGKPRDPSFYYIIAFGGLIVGLAILQGVVSARRFPPVGKPAPELMVTRVGGGSVRLSAQRGKVVLIDFWARWCKPCVRQIPALQRLHHRMKGRPFVLLSVNIERAAPRDVAKWLEQRRIEFPVTLDSTGAAKSAYRVDRIPMLVLVGKGGIVRKVYDASASEQLLAEHIEELLQAKTTTTTARLEIGNGRAVESGERSRARRGSSL